MRHLKLFEEISFEDFDNWNQKWNPVTKMNKSLKGVTRKGARKLIDIVSGKRRKEAEIEKKKSFHFSSRYFTQDDIDEIKDIFLEIQENYNLREDPDGKILNYLKIGHPSRINSQNPQFFIENNERLLIFTIASSLSFVTPSLIEDIDKFKIRLEKFGYRCDKNDIHSNVWIKYISFYIQKNLHLD